MVLKYRVLVLLFLFIVVNCNNSFSQDPFSCDISIDKKLIIPKTGFIKESKITDKSLPFYEKANDFYTKGVNNLRSGDIDLAEDNFKNALKNYKKSKISDEAISFVYMQLALTYFSTDNPRDKSKGEKMFKAVNVKTIKKDPKWSYNLGLMYYLSNNPEAKSKAKEFFDASIKSDKYFFIAYEELACVYKSLGDDKKYEKTLERLNFQKNQNRERNQRIKQNVSNNNFSSKDKKDKAHHYTITDGVEPSAVDIIIFKDIDQVFKYEKNMDWDKKAKKKILEGKKEYANGIQFYDDGEYSQAVSSFKKSARKLEQAGLHPAAPNYAKMNQALSYLKLGGRNKSKAVKQLSSLSKEASDERDFLYNTALIYYDLYLEAKNGDKRAGKDRTKNLDLSIENFQYAIKRDKYYLTPYLNLIHIYRNESKDDNAKKMANKIDRKYKKNRYELTDIYKEYILNGDKYKDVDFAFLENSIFRIYLGTYDKYNLPEDIYLHSNLITLPHEDDLDSYIMGSFDDFKKANNYLEKLLRMPIYKSNNIHIIAFKNGIRTDFE